MSKIKPDKNINITFNGYPLERVPKFEYLGFTINDNMKNDHHINKLISKAYNKVY